MKQHILLWMMLLPIVAQAQYSTLIGIEFGPKFDVYQALDNGEGLFTKAFFFSPVYGLTIEHELNNEFLSIETGVYVNDYGESYRIEGESGYSSSSAIMATQIPLRFKARLPLVPKKLHLIGTVGYTLAINHNFNSTGSGSTFTSTQALGVNDSTRSRYTAEYGFQRVYGLIEFGAALNYTFKNNMQIFLGTNYLAGVSRVVELDVTYRIEDQPEQTAEVYSNGSYYSFFLGLKYPISKLWGR